MSIEFSDIFFIRGRCIKIRDDRGSILIGGGRGGAENITFKCYHWFFVKKKFPFFMGGGGGGGGAG